MHAAVSVARTEDVIDNPNRRSGPEFRVAIARIDRQIVFQFLKIAAELEELRRLGFVAERDECFEGGLVSEQLVFVGLVRPDGNVDRRVQIHPGHVAFVVVVRHKRVRALCKKGLERLVGG